MEEGGEDREGHGAALVSELTRCSKTSAMFLTTPLVAIATRSFRSEHRPPRWALGTHRDTCSEQQNPSLNIFPFLCSVLF